MFSLLNRILFIISFMHIHSANNYHLLRLSFMFAARGDANIPGLHPCPHESDETDINDAAYETAINL